MESELMGDITEGDADVVGGTMLTVVGTWKYKDNNDDLIPYAYGVGGPKG
jgi:hypothetical protein